MSSGQSSVYEECLHNAQKWQKNFNKPLPLGARKKLAIVTCMDSRLMPASIFGLDIGDAEFIRNAAGRITTDILRSLFISQEVLNTDQIIIMHHTDCGATHAWNQRNFLIKQMPRYTGPFLGAILMFLGWFGLDKYLLQPFADNQEALEDSVRNDVAAVKKWMPPHVAIHGVVYSVSDGGIKEICHVLPKAGAIHKDAATRKEE